MRIVFMGTPDFAAEVLKSLYCSEHEIVAVYTQPDRPKGRKGELAAPPVKEYALEQGLPVYQPEKIRRKDWVTALREQKPDLMVVAAYGQILPQRILDIAPCINVHASLLPRYRGSSPIQRSIAAGDAETGVTIMRMDAGMDTGNSILQVRVPITDSDTGETMHDKLADAGAKALMRVVEQFSAGENPVGIPQDEALATYAPMLSREDGRMDWNRSARLIDCAVRAYTPWPSAYTLLEDRVLKVQQVRVFDPGLMIAEPGRVLSREQLIEADRRILVQTGQGILEICRLQLPGKRALNADEFLRGCPLWGRRLGADER